MYLVQVAAILRVKMRAGTLGPARAFTLTPQNQSGKPTITCIPTLLKRYCTRTMLYTDIQLRLRVPIVYGVQYTHLSVCSSIR